MPKQDIIPPAPKFGGGLSNEPKPTPNPQGGRPLNQKDTVTRKMKVVQPKSGESAAVLWAYNIQKTIADIITPMILEYREKKNVRSLTKGEFEQFEYLKLCLLANIEPFIEVTPELIQKLIESTSKPSSAFITEVGEQIDNFVYINNRKPTVDEMKYIYATVYVNKSEVNA